MDIKVQPRPVDCKGDFAQELERLFIEEWGGPKSALALAYLKETVIPDLSHCLTKNWHLLDNTTFRDILVSKLSTQFAYPAAFAEGLASDIIDCTKRVFGTSPVANNHPWQPWEIILRMLSIDYRLPEITQKTGYPEGYLELFRKKYLKIQEIAEERKVLEEEQLLGHSELSGIGLQLIRFVYDFRNRFTVFKYYYERLQAEQIIMELEYDLDPDTLIYLFEGLFQVEKQVNLGRFAEILKGTKTTWLSPDSYYGKTKGYGLLVDWPKKNITSLLKRLQEQNLILEELGQDHTLSLSETAGRLIVPIVVPALVDDIQNILRSKSRDKLSRIIVILQNLNPEIAIHVIQEIVRRKDNGIILCFKALQRRVSKKVFLQMIWACGQLGGRDAVSLLSKTILDRDSLVRVRTCQAMGEMASTSFYFSLISALGDDVAIVRENAALALGKLKMISAIKHLDYVISNPSEEPQVEKAARNAKTLLLKEKEIRE